MSTTIKARACANPYHLTDDARAILNAHNRAYRTRLRELRSLREAAQQAGALRPAPQRPALMTETIFAGLAA